MEADFKDVRGMADITKAVERTIVTKQNLLLHGPPGIGKTMIARRIPTILPPITPGELEALAVIYGRVVPAELEGDDWKPKTRPFRAPHHTISTVSLVGNKKHLGELDLATYGVLFLDEIGEFQRRSLMALGETIRNDDHPVTIIASTNPCPCGWNDSKRRQCSCSSDAVFKYRSRIQQICKLVDITDVITIPSMSLQQLKDAEPGDDSATIRARIMETISAQEEERKANNQDELPPG